MRLAPSRPPTKRRASFSSAFAISGPAPPEGMNPRLRPMWRTPRRPGRPHPDPSSAPARGIRARPMASRGRPRSGSAPRNQIARHHTGCPRQWGSIVQSPWSLVPACGFLCERGFYVMKEKHERGLWCGRRPLWRGPTWRERRLGMLEDGGPAQIVDGSEREDVGGDIRQAGRAGTCEAVETFHRAEHRFHRRSPPRHQFVPARSPADDLALMLVGAMHDAVLDAERFEPRATCLEWIGAIAVDGAFITADEIDSDFAFIA